MAIEVATDEFSEKPEAPTQPYGYLRSTTPMSSTPHGLSFHFGGMPGDIAVQIYNPKDKAPPSKTDLARLWRQVNGSARWPTDVDAFVNAMLTKKDTEKSELDLAIADALAALSLALSDVEWRANSPTQKVIHKAYNRLERAK